MPLKYLWLPPRHIECREVSAAATHLELVVVVLGESSRILLVVAWFWVGKEGCVWILRLIQDWRKLHIITYNGALPFYLRFGFARLITGHVPRLMVSFNFRLIVDLSRIQARIQRCIDRLVYISTVALPEAVFNVIASNKDGGIVL